MKLGYSLKRGKNLLASSEGFCIILGNGMGENWFIWTIFVLGFNFNWLGRAGILGCSLGSYKQHEESSLADMWKVQVELICSVLPSGLHDLETFLCAIEGFCSRVEFMCLVIHGEYADLSWHFCLMSSIPTSVFLVLPLTGALLWILNKCA